MASAPRASARPSPTSPTPPEETEGTTSPSPQPPTGLFSATDSPTPSTTPAASTSPAPDFGNDWATDSEFDELPARGTSSSPSAERTLSPTDKKALRKAIAAGAEAVGFGLHTVVAHPIERDFDLYLLDADDADGIAAPSANLLVRHGVVSSNADIADLIALFVAFASYVSKQLVRRRDARRYAESLTQAPPTEEAQEAAA
jgi:hypothetical protein